ncbi:MAG: phosphoribosylaminoimidazolesuccinocarboxamide synthase [Spirochaetia bacterium]
MRAADLNGLLDTCLEHLELPRRTRLTRGKVRDVVDMGTDLLICTTDRISAFDRVLTTIPCKGEILNTIALFWFRSTEDIIAHHVREEISARTIRAAKCRVIPVEVVVRGYLTGSAWRDYQNGARISGIELPTGLRFNHRFERPLLTPSTKEEKGVHDRPVSREEIIAGGIVEKALWERIEETSLALFRRGTEIAHRQGLILVDTKYEFGLHDGRLMLVDELHTPDSSRFWHADAWEQLYSQGAAQRELDKEYLRQWLLTRGWKGDGTPPQIPDEVRVQVALKYLEAWEIITGRGFTPRALDAQEESSLVAGLLPASS